MRIVMWSGPRNLSTAMMRSFGARADTDVVDEPFYAAYLAITGLDHPMRAEILAAGETDWRRVAARLSEAPPPGRLRYEKHMAHHMVPQIDLGWIAGAKVAFLIRDPREVAASYAAKREAFTLDDLGIDRQAELFAACTEMLGTAPPVVDAADIRRAPEPVLRALCAALGIGFDPAMLAWEPGPRETDGIWAPHWYAAVNRSTGFAPPPARPGPPASPEPEIAAMLAPAMESYRALSARALRGEETSA
ncbi:branched chain amino acid aminotransferase [Paralimibaculum aggregatum]|uniref:Branched chain amino acid aminotransferase n=1 Tax=Paralimibaculum aggregatum TaxID=3036245 RepID=A0ABQ6LJS9_9RHOB|nr:HAD family hydrolase [Limibaculum sp. NKW23]GMG83509.1 branched chain amino acid aminotransferase [Limibaculum sp. NKW23]